MDTIDALSSLSPSNSPLRQKRKLTYVEQNNHEVQNKLQGLQNMSEALATLKNLPDIRPEKVAKAQQLLRDPKYPNEQDLDKVVDALLDSNTH